MPLQPVDIQFPLGGLHRAYALQQQAPYTSADMVNVWPRDVFEGRMRGGSRPGLRKVFSTPVTGPVHLIGNVRIVEDTGLVTFSDDFTSYVAGAETPYPALRLPGIWDRATWRPHELLVLNDQAHFVYALDRDPTAISHIANFEPTNGGAVLRSLGIDISAVYTIRMHVVPNRDFLSHGTLDFGVEGDYSIDARMATTNPNPNNSGIELRCVTQGSGTAHSTAIELYSNGSLVTSAGPIGGTTQQHGYLVEMDILTDDKVTVRFENEEVLTRVSIDAHSGQRLGLSIAGDLIPNVSGVPTYRVIQEFVVDYTGKPPAPNRNIVVVVGGTNASTTAPAEIELKYEDTPNKLVDAGTYGTGGGDETMTNDNARHLQSAEMLGKLYIVGEDAQDAPSDAPLWVFDPTGTGAIIAMEDETGYTGTAPVNGIAIAVWNARVCVVSRDDQQNVSMSRVNAPENWAYATLPTGSAIKLDTTGIDSGKVSEPINALISHSDDYLLLGCTASLWVLRGDPTLGGVVDQMSRTVGIISPQAWARGPNSEAIFLSADGLYALPPGMLAYPESVSREVLPNELRDVDTNHYRVLMAYDVRNRGIFIGITPIAGSGGTYFWFDWEVRRFFPMEFEPEHEPMALGYRNADSPVDQLLMLGCRDGHVRTFGLTQPTDDGANFRSEVLIGPIALGGGGYFDGMLNEVVGQLARSSGDVTMTVQVGNSIEAARHAIGRSSYTFVAGKNRTHRPRLRGNACFIRLSSSGGSAWAFENLTLVRERLGKQRL